MSYKCQKYEYSCIIWNMYFFHIHVCIYTCSYVDFWGKLQIVFPQCGRWQQEGNLHVGTHLSCHRAITAHHQMLLWVSIPCISPWLFIHPPHKSYFTICQLFPKALGCPLDMLCGFAQSKHAPQACGLYFCQGFLAAVTYWYYLICSCYSKQTNKISQLLKPSST